MKKYKHGFTLVEILISLSAIGIIMALSVNAIRSVRASYASLAYFAFKNVSDAVGVLYAGNMTETVKEKCDPAKNTAGRDCKINTAGEASYYVYNPQAKYNGDELVSGMRTESLYFGNESLTSMVNRCKNTETGLIVNVLKNDNEKDTQFTGNCNARTAGGSENLFCKSFAALTNITGEAKCSSLFDTAAPASDKDPAFDIPSNKETFFDNPNMIWTNGMRIYISKWKKHELVSNQYGYRLVGVDLNGKSKPNAVSSSSDSVPADLVTFLVLDNGEVYPLGTAADNQDVSKNRTLQYLNAKVKGYQYSAYTTGTDGNRKLIERDPLDIPAECSSIPDDADAEQKKNKCNFGVFKLQNQYRRASTDAASNFSYRQALCTAKQGTGLGYENYCKNDGVLVRHPLCPPASVSSMSIDDETIYPYDQCRVDLIKPAFRFDLQ